MTEIVAVSRIRELNDQFRAALTGGLLHITVSAAREAGL